MKTTLAIDKRLRRQLLPIFLLLITSGMGLSLVYRIDDVRKQNMEVVTEGMRNLFRFIVLTRKWDAEHGGVYVFASEQAPVNTYLEHPERELELSDKRKLVLMNPAYMTRQIADLSAKDPKSDMRFHITSRRPIRPQNQADAWEDAALIKFEQGLQEFASVEKENGQNYLRYMAPLFIEKECLTCHARQGYKLGDVRGGISVSVKLAPVEKTVQAEIRATVWRYAAYYGLIVAVSWGLIELLARRWRALDDNIETLRTTRNQLVETEKMASLGRLVAGFAHEINTPVGVAVGAITHGDETIKRLRTLMMQDEVSERDLTLQLDYLQESHELAFSNLRRAADLVQRFKRTSIDCSSEQQREYQLDELIQDVLMVLRNVLKHTAIEVKVECPKEIKLYGTPGLLEQVLTNLITNSITHGFDDGKRPGRIVIKAMQTDLQRLIIDYQDDGAGMSEKVKRQVFEPFYTTRRDRGGSGLGLYVTYNIVTQQMGGSIQIVSEPDAGARFLIDCPIDIAPYVKEASP